MRNLTWTAAAVFVLSCCATAEDTKAEDKLPVVFEDDFENGADRWEPTDTKAWKIEDEGGNKVFHLFQGSDYAPPVRSPLNIAWIKDLNVSDFVFEGKLKQTGKEYGHRDLCIFFGKQDAAHFYYVHIATKADDHANSIFLVNNEPRVSIAKDRTSGTDWGSTDSYNTVRVVRNTESGSIEVYFNDMEKPIMVAEDKTFATGAIGIGSFDDVGCFDDIVIRAKVVK
ncbi:MAG: hypothetical protein AMXMBFR84_11440 [Candidatus Hydrogenedentota bacterium]